MIVSVVIDPDFLDMGSIEDKDNCKFIHEVFRRIAKSGVLVADSKGIIVGEIVDNIDDLPTEYAKDIRIIITEILKRKRKRIVNIKTSKNNNLMELCLSIEEKAPSDALMTNSDKKEQYLQKRPRSEVVTEKDYLGSEISQKINKFTEGSVHTESLDKEGFKELIARVAQFSDTLKLYDKQLGKASNIEGFKRGIKKILDVWKKAYFLGRERKLDIYTCTQEVIPKDSDPSVVSDQIQVNKNNVEKVKSKIIREMSLDNDINIDLHVKMDRDNKFHARYISNGSFHINMERGLDYLNADGSLKSFPLTLSPEAEEYLGNFRTAPDARLST